MIRDILQYCSGHEIPVFDNKENQEDKPNDEEVSTTTIPATTHPPATKLSFNPTLDYMLDQGSNTDHPMPGRKKTEFTTLFLLYVFNLQKFNFKAAILKPLSDTPVVNLEIIGVCTDTNVIYQTVLEKKTYDQCVSQKDVTS